MRPTRVLTIAVEVADVLFPEILKIAAHDIERCNLPISIYQACALDIYQRDPQLARANLLRDHGFGIITVDDGGAAVIQCRAEPISQHIPPERIDEQLRKLTPTLKIKFRAAHATYQTNIGQGLQEAGQIIEALIASITNQAVAKGVVSAATGNKATAGKIDDLYQTNAFQNHRATLGGARDFARTYRNSSSHPAQTLQQATEKIRRCKSGFVDALRIAGELRSTMQAMGYQIRIV
jgi:hypothetical protein